MKLSTSVPRCMLLALTVLMALMASLARNVEEFHVFGPTEFHDVAVDQFVQMRKQNKDLNMDKDSPFMIEARKEAVKRYSMRPEEDIKILNPITLLSGSGEADKAGLLVEDGSVMKQLPTPADLQSILTNAVNAQSSSSYDLVLPQQAQAEAASFGEQIGLGAISKAGALLLGGEGQWLSFAEDKLKKENDLDYQSLLWEMGTSILEKKSVEKGTGINSTMEENLLLNMKEWFIKGGGKLNYVEPHVSTDGTYSLRATEDVEDNEVVVSVPMKLIMCQQTARNILIPNKGRYLGEELTKTFEKNEIWGLSIFLLHEYYKEKNGGGSKWGPFLKTLRMRVLTKESLTEIRGTMAMELNKEWVKSAEALMWFAGSADGPCSPSSGICKTKPKEITGETRFNMHHLRWAYWVVKQNAVRVRHATTGYEFIGLVPFYSMMAKTMDEGGGISFDFDGSINIRSGKAKSAGLPVGLHPGNYSDSEYFLRYMRTPVEWNSNTILKLSLPGTIPKGSKFHYCIKGTEEQMRSDECKGSYRSDVMFWKSKVLGEWRKEMNLPPRMQELRQWATKLHLYGGAEEQKLLSASNRMIAGLPIPVDQMPAEEQLMLMGVARDSKEAALIVQGDQENAPPPQLYSAPDPDEDPEAKRYMENLAFLAAQTQAALSSGNVVFNATRAVLNHTKNFFLHGILPMAGLDELDNFLLKKIGMLSHCGFENDMKITTRSVSDQLMCAMRVHLMNETEVGIFCPADAMVWEDACLNIHFANFSAISYENEMSVIKTLRGSMHSMIRAYPTTIEEDQKIISDYEDELELEEKDRSLGEITYHSIRLRKREKELLLGALGFLDEHEERTKNGNITFQIIEAAKERVESTIREEAHKKFVEEVKRRAEESVKIVATIEVNMGENVPKANLTLLEGEDINQTILKFLQKHKAPLSNTGALLEALKARIPKPPPLTLQLGVVTPLGDRKVLGIPARSNITMETGVFCARNNITDRKQCKDIEARVNDRLNVKFQRNVRVSFSVNAPDSRELTFVIHEGEQHELLQHCSDFCELYGLPLESAPRALQTKALELMSPAIFSIPVEMGKTRPVTIQFSKGDNITNVVEGFANSFEADPNLKLAILKRARFGMNPGTFIV